MSAPTAPAQRDGVRLNTTGATVTTIATLATETNKSYIVTATVVAVEQADHDESAGYVRVGTFQNDGGTLTQIGSTAAVATMETTAGWDCELFVTGTTIGCRVTGAASTVIDWLANLDVQQVPG